MYVDIDPYPVIGTKRHYEDIVPIWPSPGYFDENIEKNDEKITGKFEEICEKSSGKNEIWEFVATVQGIFPQMQKSREISDALFSLFSSWISSQLEPFLFLHSSKLLLRLFPQNSPNGHKRIRLVSYDEILFDIGVCLWLSQRYLSDEMFSSVHCVEFMKHFSKEYQGNNNTEENHNGNNNKIHNNNNHEEIIHHNELEEGIINDHNELEEGIINDHHNELEEGIINDHHNETEGIDVFSLYNNQIYASLSPLPTASFPPHSIEIVNQSFVAKIRRREMEIVVALDFNLSCN